MAAKSKVTEKAKRRSPISRAEGEQRLVSAARELIKTKPFSEVGVRDIAELADVNHGFVHTWFGSKNDLLLAVVREMAMDAAKKAAEAEPGQMALDVTDPELQLFIRLVLWLNLEGVNTRKALPELPIVNALEKRYVEIEGMRPDVAHIAAIQTASIGIGGATFAPLITADDNIDLPQVMGLLRHIIGLLAKYPPA